MKELSIEEKAKRYDEILVRAKGADIPYYKEDIMSKVKEFVDYLLPELKESENDDEKIRKMLIAFVKNDCIIASDKNKQDALAWLEKQGDIDRRIQEEIEKQTKQQWKAEKQFEPKFKVGDWIMSNVSHEDYRICKILKIENGEYVIESIYGYKGHNNFETFDKDYHLWTTQDAKDGDVLTVEDIVFIYKRTLSSHIVSYCNLIDGKFDSFEYGRTCCEENTYVHPATKEQRDLLFQKMHEVGYEWDAEKKELKKIEQTSAWSEEDEEMEKLLQPEYEKGKAAVIEAVMNSVIKDKESAIKFLKSAGIIDDNGELAKEYVADNIEQNPAWGEEDESMLQNILECLKNGCRKLPTDVLKYESWFQSIKDRVQQQQEWSEEDEKMLKWLCRIVHSQRLGKVITLKEESELGEWMDKWLNHNPQNTWKPSDEQIATFWDAICNLNHDGYKWIDDFKSLFQDLNKLRGE